MFSRLAYIKPELIRFAGTLRKKEEKKKARKQASKQARKILI